MARIPTFPTEKRQRTRPTVNLNSSAQVIELPVSPNPSASSNCRSLRGGSISRIGSNHMYCQRYAAPNLAWNWFTVDDYGALMIFPPIEG